MNRILLASHGPLAQGMKDTLSLLVGDNDRIDVLCAYINDQTRDVAKLIDEWQERCSPDDFWLVITDIFGGSVNNEFLVRLDTGNYQLVAGMNLPLLVELSVMIDALDEDLLESILASCRQSIQLCHPLATSVDDEEDF